MISDEELLKLICDNTGKRINLPNFTLEELKDFARGVIQLQVAKLEVPKDRINGVMKMGEFEFEYNGERIAFDGVDEWTTPATYKRCMGLMMYLAMELHKARAALQSQPASTNRVLDEE